MRVLISAYLCEPHRGSELGFGWNWTLEMAKIGHEVWCFTRPEGKEAIEAEAKNFPELKMHFVYIHPPGWVEFLHSIEKRFPPFYYIWFYTNYLVWQRKAARKAKQLDREVNFDLIHHVTMGSFQLSSQMWRLKKPLIFGPVGGGNFPPKAFREYFGSAWRREKTRMATSNLLLRFNRSTRRTAQRAAVVLVTNSDTRDMAERIKAGNVEIFLDTGLPAAFFPDEMPPRENQGALKILWVGRMMPRKGLPIVLEALAKVKPEFPFTLTILGGGYLEHTVRPLIKKLHLEDRVDWRGQVPWEEVRKAYLTHHVFMFCSLRDSFGAQFLEAMAHGLPIITLDHQGAGDHIPDDAGVKVPVTTPAETTDKLARAVEYLFSHREICTRFGECGFEFARTQSWQLRAARMDDLYRKYGLDGRGRS